MRRGVLLFNLGGPEQQSDVRPFLYNLFSDPDIVRLPIRSLQKPLAWIISTARHKKSSGYYAQIGGGSPLRRITDEQAGALEQELARRGLPAQVYVGMRYWSPFTAQALERIRQDRITDLLVLPLYPQYSVSTTGSSLRDFIALLESKGGLREIRRHYITRWHEHPAYLDVLAAMIRAEIEKFPDQRPGSVTLLFSAHGVPESYIERGDPYLRQTQQTMAGVLRLLPAGFPAHLSFQSKVGPVKWLEPSTDTKLRELHASGAKQVLTIPISFVSDHIETLYELDILYRKLASDLGIETYRRVPAFNCNPAFIASLADLVEARFARVVRACGGLETLIPDA